MNKELSSHRLRSATARLIAVQTLHQLRLRKTYTLIPTSIQMPLAMFATLKRLGIQVKEPLIEVRTQMLGVGHRHQVRRHDQAWIATSTLPPLFNRAVAERAFDRYHLGTIAVLELLWAAKFAAYPMGPGSGSSLKRNHKTKVGRMANYLDKLLSIASNPVVADRSATMFEDERKSPKIESELGELLESRNGFFCFASSLQVFPAQSRSDCFGIADWNDNKLWKTAYAGLADDLLCFAQDIFGNQFAITGGKIVVFSAETGETSIFAFSLEEWARKILDDFDYLTGYTFAKEWQELHGPLPVGMRLCPTTPFIMGGEYKLQNMQAMEGSKVLKTLGYFATQIHGQPDGTKIRFSIIGE